MPIFLLTIFLLFSVVVPCEGYTKFTSPPVTPNAELERLREREILRKDLNAQWEQWRNDERARIDFILHKEAEANKAETAKMLERAQSAVTQGAALLDAITLWATIFGVVVAVLTFGLGLLGIISFKGLSARVEAAAVENLRQIEKYRDKAQAGSDKIEELSKSVTNILPENNNMPNQQATDAAESISKTPEAQPVRRADAINAIEREEWPLARALWENVLREEPHAPDAHFYAGLAAHTMATAATSQKEKISLRLAAEKHYKKSLERKKDSPEALNNLGLLLTDFAEAAAHKPEEQHQFWDKAEECYRTVINYNPRNAATWCNWGNLLSDRADAAAHEPEEQRQFWDKAEEYYRKATECDLSKYNVWCNWGDLLADRAEAAAHKPEEQRAFWDKAEEYYRKATVCNPDSGSAWCNWGKLLADRAEAAAHKPEEQREFWDKAAKYYRKAIECDPDSWNAWCNWGDLLADRAEAAAHEPEEQRKFWDKAEEYYCKANECDPNSGDVWLSWGSLFADRGKAAAYSSDEQRKFWDKAEEYYRKANTLAPLTRNVFYNLACLAALRHQPDACLDYLESAFAVGELPSITDLDTDPDFDFMRGREAFTLFMEKVRRGHEGV